MCFNVKDLEKECSFNTNFPCSQRSKKSKKRITWISLLCIIEMYVRIAIQELNGFEKKDNIIFVGNSENATKVLQRLSRQ